MMRQGGDANHCEKQTNTKCGIAQYDIKQTLIDRDGASREHRAQRVQDTGKRYTTVQIRETIKALGVDVRNTALHAGNRMTD